MNFSTRLSILFSKDAVKKIVDVVYLIGKPIIDALIPVLFGYYAKIQFKVSGDVIEKIKRHIVELYLDINKSELKDKDKLFLLLTLLKERIVNELEIEQLYKDCKDVIKKELESDSLWLYLIQLVILQIKRNR
mgnify:CR=1 FL=1